MICQLLNAKPRSKMAGFDFDYTLFRPKYNNYCFQSVDDWELCHPTIKQKLENTYVNGYMIVVFANMMIESWGIQMIQKALTSLCLPLFIVYANRTLLTKPNANLYIHFQQYIDEVHNIPNFQINRKSSFYIGDAMGRAEDWFDYDKRFAETIGIYYFTENQFHYSIDIL